MPSQTSKKRIWMGYWILAALLIGGYSSSQLMNLFSPVLPGLSREIKSARQKLNQINESITLYMEEDINNLHLKEIFERFTLSPKKQKKGTILQKKKPKPIKKEEKVVLPKIEGILQVINISGETRYKVMIDGKCLNEYDRVNNLTVKKITPEGVTLTKGDKKWFIPAPKVYFSFDRGL
jgi:hypothetical protein